MNPDILLVALLTFFIEMCVRACREPTRRSIVAVGVTAALVALTKPIGAPAAVAVALPIVGICAGSFSPTRRALALLVAAPLCGVAAAAFGRIVISADPTNGRGFLAAAKFGLSDIWQFYLPRLWFMQEHRPLNIPAGIPAGWIWLRGGIGQFGWQFLTMPAWVYHLGGVSLLVLACAAAVGSPRTPNARVPVAVLAGAALYILLLHLSTLDTMLRTNTTILQGRYLLPILPAMIAALFSLTGGLGRRFGLLLGCFLVAARMVFAWQADLTVIEFYG